MASARIPVLGSAVRWLGGSALVAGAGFLLHSGSGLRTSLGASWRKDPVARPESDHFDGTTFHNLLPSSVIDPVSMPAIAKAMLTRGDIGKPTGPIPLATASFVGPVADLAVTWLGHASALLEIDGVRVLADPVWSDRVSPSQLVGPKRMHAMPVRFDEIPPLDAIIISHDHYDHLDLDTVELLRDHHQAPFVVPLGVGEHLRGWNVPDDRIIELDWDQSHTVGTVTLTCTQARHFSGRGLSRNDTLWSSWALAGPRHRVFFGGDTGYTPEFAQIGANYGPFDLTLIPIGAYNEHWADIHLNPEEAVQTHLDVQGGILLPIHWATFDLAFHSWVEPITRLLDSAEKAGVRVLIPRPGQRVEDPETATADEWWRLS